MSDWICEKGSYSVCIYIYLSIYCVTGKYMLWYRHKVWSPYILNMVLFLRAILHQQPDHTMSCNHLNLGIRKGYKTSFQKSGHNCDPAGLTKKDL